LRNKKAGVLEKHLFHQEHWIEGPGGTSLGQQSISSLLLC